MCTRFMTLGVQTNGSCNAAFEAAGQDVGVMPGGPRGSASPVARWQLPDIEPRLAKMIAADAAHEPRFGVLTPGYAGTEGDKQ